MKKDVLAGYVRKFNQNDEETIRQTIGNEQALAWMQEHIPYFECADKTMEETYYFRWWVFRKHLKETPEGCIFTEFLSDVPWAGPYNSINCASGHHIAEARWLRDGGKYVDDYIRFWFRGSGDVFSYSCWIVMAVYEYCLTTGDFRIAIELLKDFVKYYTQIERTHMTRHELFWSNDDRDAMEKSISGSGLRPTLNSYMYANARAISEIAARAGDATLCRMYAAKATVLKGKINRILWDDTAQFYKAIPLAGKDSEIEELSFSKVAATHNVREEIGFIPWSFGIAEQEHDIAWKYLMDNQYFGAKCGPLTAERCHFGSMQPNGGHECLWNGPSWPFATTQTINGIISALTRRKSEHLHKTDFMRLMRCYSKCHFRIREDGTKVNWLDENLDPDTGEWLSRKVLQDSGWPDDKGGYERGKDYNHSAFCDLIIRGICGVHICAEEAVHIKPLLPEGLWDYFLLDDLPYKGRNLTILYDVTGEHYKKGRGLLIFVDGVLAKKTDITDETEVHLGEPALWHEKNRCLFVTTAEGSTAV